MPSVLYKEKSKSRTPILVKEVKKIRVYQERYGVLKGESQCPRFSHRLTLVIAGDEVG